MEISFFKEGLRGRSEWTEGDQVRVTMNGKHCQLKGQAFHEYNWKYIYLIFIFNVKTNKQTNLIVHIK